ncbi:MAG TPA: sensor histidine kinase, partial [Polyangiaceae bacterium]|nr:sensor histidine kinase [Polyangiaceae bacterium]
PPAPSIEPELDALDDAMKMLATLHTGSASRNRRGRIDLAALLWEAAPDARVSIEPGSGTDVFGDEAELRRMLQVLVGTSNPTGGGPEMGTPELSIRREGSEIRVSVTLGPDSSANAETERAWLSRMATRYGGRFELEGGTESIFLPADGADEQREVEDLRRELEAAQRQGEAYARELASVFSYSQSPPPRFSSKPSEYNRALSALTAMAAGISFQLTNIFKSLENEAPALHEGRTPAAANEMAADLLRLSQCPLHESVQHVNLADAVRAAMAELEPRALLRGVTLKSQIPAHANLNSRPVATHLLARTLISDAISATPRDGEVLVLVEALEPGGRLVVDDGGPVIPEEAWSALLTTQIDPASAGRPATIALFVASTLAQHLGTHVGLLSPAEGRGRLEVKFSD